MDDNARRLRAWAEQHLVPQLMSIACAASGSVAISVALRSYSDTVRFVFFAMALSCLAKAYSVVIDEEATSDAAILRAIRSVADGSDSIFTVERVVAELRGVSVQRVERIILDLERRSRITWQMTDDGVILYQLPGGPVSRNSSEVRAAADRLGAITDRRHGRRESARRAHGLVELPP